MNTLRPTLLRQSQTLQRGSALSSVVKKSNDSTFNAANLAGKYWRREYHGSSGSWNQLRSHLPYVAGPHNDSCHENAKSSCHPIRDTGISLRAFSSSPLLLQSSLQRNSFSIPLTPKMMKDSCISDSVRTSSHFTKSKVDFSTMRAMPHSTSASNSKGNNEPIKESGDIDSMPASQKARFLFKKYGTVFVGTYLGIYFTTLASFFVALDFGLLDPDTLSQVFKVSKDMACETADIIGPTGTGASMNEAANAYATEMNAEMKEDRRTLVEIVSGYLLSWEWTSRYAEKLSENPHMANLAVAWFMVKFTEPIRLAAAVIVTPKVAKVLGRKEVEDESEKKS